jgi:hypothetical protein
MSSKNSANRAPGIASGRRRLIATACCPAERNQTLPPTTTAKTATIASQGRMLNDPTPPPADREKKKYSATAAITASIAQRNQNQNFTTNCNYAASNERQNQRPSTLRIGVRINRELTTKCWVGCIACLGPVSEHKSLRYGFPSSTRVNSDATACQRPLRLFCQLLCLGKNAAILGDHAMIVTKDTVQRRQVAFGKRISPIAL